MARRKTIINDNRQCKWQVGMEYGTFTYLAGDTEYTQTGIIDPGDVQICISHNLMSCLDINNEPAIPISISQTCLTEVDE